MITFSACERQLNNRHSILLQTSDIPNRKQSQVSATPDLRRKAIPLDRLRAQRYFLGMTPDPKVLLRFKELHWPLLPTNLEALEELERRLWRAAASRGGNPLVYKDWVRGVEFIVPHFFAGVPFSMTWEDGQDGNDLIIGDILGWINARSYEAHGVLLSAMAMNKKTSRPGNRFFGLSEDVGLFSGKTDKDRYRFWMEQIRLVTDFARANPLPEPVDYNTFVRYVKEGELAVKEMPVRKRCEELAAAARQAHLSPDGELECIACGWRKPTGPITGNIIQMHHLDPLAGAPDEGRFVNLADAKRLLLPLCPNCHSISHAKAGGGTFSVDELKELSGRGNQGREA